MGERAGLSVGCCGVVFDAEGATDGGPGFYRDLVRSLWRRIALTLSRASTAST